MVEFALVFPLTLLLVIGILDFGKAINYFLDETHVASTGARFAVVDKNPGAGDGLSLQQYLKQRLLDTNELSSNAQVCIDFTGDGAKVGEPVQVSVTYGYDWLPYLDDAVGISSTNIKARATMRLEQAPTAYEAGCA